MTLKLRALEPSDIDALYKWENDESTLVYGRTRTPLSRELLTDYVMNYNPDLFAAGQLRMIIADTDTQTSIGALDLYDVDSINRRAGIGIVIDSQYRVMGYGREALIKLVQHSYLHFGLHQLWAMSMVENKASCRLFESVGFKTTGRLNSWVRVGESYNDVLIYQLILTKDSILKLSNCASDSR